MRQSTRLFVGLAFLVVFLFGFAAVMESSAWARAGRGGSFGSRGSRTYSAPRTPTSPYPSSPGINNQGTSSTMGTPGQAAPSTFGRSPFLTGLAGGLAGGLLGSLLFGGSGHAAAGGMAGGGIGLLDIALIGLLLYIAWRFLKRRRMQAVSAGSYRQGGYSGSEREYTEPASCFRGSQSDAAYQGSGEVGAGLQQLRQFDPNFTEEGLKETLQDGFFRIQAAWMNRSLDGAEEMFTNEMAESFRGEFESMKQRGIVNRLENIAVRKVEITEAWQEMGMDYVTVLFTANLLDYTLDEATGQVVEGDKLTPVKFQELWTFCRDIGSSQWKLSAIHQAAG